MGIIPDTRSRPRFRFDQRWPGIVELELHKAGVSVRVIEDCLNGRRTVWKDPFKPGRNGLEGLEQRIEINSPLSLVVVYIDIVARFDKGNLIIDGYDIGKTVECEY